MSVIRHLRKFLFIFTCILLAGYANSTLATINERLPEAKLSGMEPLGHGKLSFFGLHIYDATLYTPSKDFSLEKLTEARLALALRYAREIDGIKIAERTESEIAKQKSASENERADWLAQLKVLIPNVKKGDVLTGAYAPNQGTGFYLNGKLLGEIKGARFAQSFFGIWLAENTSQPGLRKALLSSLAAGKTP
jgi:Chalcone isomerase-like